jgi:hypothetical protein
MPRGAAVGHGFRGPGQYIFPELAREQGRQLGLYTDEVLPMRAVESKSAGATRITYVADSDYVRGRIDALGSSSGGTGTENVINEASTHIVSVDAGVGMAAKDRCEALGIVWIITAVREVTDPLIERYEVEQLSE